MKLTERSFTLIIEGARINGDFRQAYLPMEERFYTTEIDEVINFCAWIDAEVGGASYINIRWLYDAYKNPNDKKLRQMTSDLKAKIQRLRQLT